MKGLLMKKVFLILIIIVTITLSGCSTAKKLADLGYPEIDIEKIEEKNIAKDIVNNEIEYDLYKQVLNFKEFNEDNQEVYFRLLNKSFNFQELELLIKGVNTLIKEDNKYMEDQNLNNNNAKDIFSSNLNPQINLLKTKFEADKNIKSYNLIDHLVVKSPVDERENISIDISEKIDLSNIGKKNISITAKDNNGFITEKDFNVNVVDTTKPRIKFNSKNEFLENEEVHYKDDFTCIDNLDGDLTDDVEIEVIKGDLESPGIHEVKYTVSDSSSNKTEYLRKINITKLYSLGESFDIGEYTLKFISYRYSDTDSEPQTGYYSYYEAEEGQTYIIFKLEIKNNGKKEAQPFDTWEDDTLDAELEIGEGYVYNDVGHWLENNWNDSFVSLKALQSKTLNLTFEIPDTFANSSEKILIKISNKKLEDVEYVDIQN
jgi:hypothetical protein